MNGEKSDGREDCREFLDKVVSIERPNNGIDFFSSTLFK